MKRNLTNHECVIYAARLQEFSNKGGSIFGRNNKWYDESNPDGVSVSFTVYSYGTHFPMYVYDYQTQRWYGNSSKYSRTTSKHQSLMRPSVVEDWYDTNTLSSIAFRGITRVVERRLEA